MERVKQCCRFFFSLLAVFVFLACLAVFSGLAKADAPVSGPCRIVTLAPNLTALALSLGVGELVGCAEKSSGELPAGAVGVGPYNRPDLERIVALRPDLCLAVGDGTPPETVRRLRALKIRVVVLEPDTFAGLDTTLERLGAELGHEAEAERLRTDMAARLARVDAVVSSIPVGGRPVTLVQIQASPAIFAGQDTFAGELIRRAGGRNPVPAGRGYPRLGIERVLALAPDVVVITRMTRAEEAVAVWRRFPCLPATKFGRIHVVDADLFSQPTLRSLDALEELVELLHPGLLRKAR